MLAKDKVKLAALRAIKSAFLLEITKDGSKSELSDQQHSKLFLSFINKEWMLIKFMLIRTEKI